MPGEFSFEELLSAQEVIDTSTGCDCPWHQGWHDIFRLPKHQWLFLVPLKGGRDYITPQKAIYKWYILPIGGLYNPYHLLGEPETAIENTHSTCTSKFEAVEPVDGSEIPIPNHLGWKKRLVNNGINYHKGWWFQPSTVSQVNTSYRFEQKNMAWLTPVGLKSQLVT